MRVAKTWNLPGSLTGYGLLILKRHSLFIRIRGNSRNRIEELIIEGQSCGEIRQDLSSSQLATSVLYSVRGVVYSWCLPDTDFNLEKISEDLFEVLQEGLRKR